MVDVTIRKASAHDGMAQNCRYEQRLTSEGVGRITKKMCPETHKNTWKGNTNKASVPMQQGHEYLLWRRIDSEIPVTIEYAERVPNDVDNTSAEIRSSVQ